LLYDQITRCDAQIAAYLIGPLKTTWLHQYQTPSRLAVFTVEDGSATAARRAMIGAPRAAMQAFLHDPQHPTVAPRTPYLRTDKSEELVWLAIDNVRYERVEAL